MAVDFSRLDRAEVNRRILTMLQDGRVHEHRFIAINAVNQFNALIVNKLDTTAFNASVVEIASRLDVAIPAVPADLDSLTNAQAVALAQQMELAEWDYYKRSDCLSQCFQYWRTLATANTPTIPTSAQYLNTWLSMMNYVRAKRGLSALT